MQAALNDRGLLQLTHLVASRIGDIDTPAPGAAGQEGGVPGWSQRPQHFHMVLRPDPVEESDIPQNNIPQNCHLLCPFLI